MSNAEQELNDQIRDEAFRVRMKEQAQTEPEAKRWVDLDTAAASQGQRVGDYEAEIAKRQNLSLEEVEQRLQEAKDSRDDFLSDRKRPLLLNREYDDRLAGLHKEVEDMQKLFEHRLQYSSPEKIADLQERMEEKRQGLERTFEERQAIAMLPSEERAAAQTKTLEERTETVLSMETPHDFQGSHQKEYDTPVRGVIDFSNYAKTAAEELAYLKQLEEDQVSMHRQLGRRATDEEMQAYQAQREAKSVDTVATSLGAEFTSRVEARRQASTTNQDGEDDGRARIPTLSTFAERKAAWTEQRSQAAATIKEEQAERMMQAHQLRHSHAASM